MAPLFTRADLAYLADGFFTLEELCAGRQDTPADVRDLIDRGLLPRPSYVLEDGMQLFPTDYFALLDQAGDASRLRDVSALDELERAFTPDYDRRRFGRPPTRDLLIAAARERPPDVLERPAVL